MNIETLREFKERTEGFSRESLWFDEQGNFWANSDGLKAKVDSQGNLKPFYGDTVVFLLDGPAMDRLRTSRRSWTRAAPIC